MLKVNICRRVFGSPFPNKVNSSHREYNCNGRNIKPTTAARNARLETMIQFPEFLVFLELNLLLRNY